MTDWLTLPQLARSLELAESTARRWAAAFPTLFITQGHGAARRFHPSARNVLQRIQVLYAAGMTTEEVAARLDAEFPKTLDVIPIDEAPGLPYPTDPREIIQAIVQQQGQVRQDIADMREAVMAELTASRKENAALREYIEDRLVERDKMLVETMRALLEQRQQGVPSQKRSWLPWKRPSRPK